jgi:hypothetical protein
MSFQFQIDFQNSTNLGIYYRNKLANKAYLIKRKNIAYVIKRKNIKNKNNTFENVNSYECNIRAFFGILNNEALHCIFEVIKKKLDYGIIFVKPSAN